MIRYVTALVLVTPACAGPLNFRNVTATNVVQTSAEQVSNEKHVDLGDFDNDNDLDVVVGVAYSDFGARRNKLYRNDAGVFTELPADPFIPGFADNRVTRSVFLRDLNGDCVVDTPDFLDLLAAWGPHPGHPADLDGDGVVGVTDFLALLAAWNPDGNLYLLEILARQH